MTIAIEAVSVTVLGTGAQTIFNYGFPIPDATACALIYTDIGGNQVTLAPATYALTGVGSPGGGTFTYPLSGGYPIGNGTSLTLVRRVPYKQLTNFTNQGGYYPQTVEAALDYLELQIQQLEAKALRAISINVADSLPMQTLPPAAMRAGQGLVFDDAGDATVGLLSSTAIGAALQAFVTAASLARARGLLGVRQVFNVLGFGPSVGTGGDDILAIQAAVNACIAAGGGYVYFPAGNYNISSTISVPASGVKLIGDGRGAVHDTAPLAPATTTITWMGVTGGSMVVFSPVAGSTGQGITDWAFLGIHLLSGANAFVTNGSGVANNGLTLVSCSYGEADLLTTEFVGFPVLLTCMRSLTEGQLCSHNKINLLFRQQNQSGTAMQIGGTTDGAYNSCFNNIVIVGNINNGIGVDIQDGDNNVFERFAIHAIGPVGTPLIFLRGSITNGPQGARGNLFREFSQGVTGGAIYSEGPGDRSGLVTGPATGNTIDRFDYSNTSPTTYISNGSDIYIGSNIVSEGMRNENNVQSIGYGQRDSGIWEIWGRLVVTGAGATVVALPGNIIISKYVMDIHISPQVACPTPPYASGVTLTQFTANLPVAGTYTFRILAL